MGCPYFIDYARECVEDIRALPEGTITLCDSESYTQCPFYLKKQNNVLSCKHIGMCHFFNHFSMDTFNDFIALTKTFCLSDNHVNCARYNLKEFDKLVPDDLAPDGTRLSLVKESSGA